MAQSFFEPPTEEGAQMLENDHKGSEEKLLTPAEVAIILRVSVDFVLREFRYKPGVLDLSSGKTKIKRPYRILRIPESVLVQYMRERSLSRAEKTLRMNSVDKSVNRGAA